MKHPKILRALALAMALVLTAAAAPAAALAAQTDTVELVATDITLDRTHFEYTGQEIRPNVTVRAGGKLLTLDREYSLEFKNNVEVGTAAVVVTGIATGGYTGTAEHPFYIDPRTSDQEQQDPVTIVGTDVLIEGTEFPFTGEAVEPAVTVTVAGTRLTAGEDYTLVYENNIQPGTASVTVTGVADRGYTGSVTIHFTVLPAAADPEETQPETTLPEETQPETTLPEETLPEASQPGETQPETTGPQETQPVSYQITQGDGAAWQQGSGKDLSFATDADLQKLEKLRIDGKILNSKYYTAEGKTVTLKAQFLRSLDQGKHTVTLIFPDGEAQGSFRVTAPADDSNPKTGDSIHLWSALLFVALTGMAGGAFLFVRKLRK